MECNIKTKICTCDLETCGLIKSINENNGYAPEPIIVETVIDAIQFVKRKQSESRRKTLFFRGHSSSEFKLIPSIYRPVKEGSHTEYVKEEDFIFREMTSRHPKEFDQCKTTFEKLTIMQHYGLPTRLLDVSLNPLVALYYACQKEKDNKPGVFFAFQVEKENIKHVDSDTVSVLSNCSKLPYDFDIEDSGCAYSPMEKLLHEIKEEKPYFLNAIKKEHLNNTILCVKPRWNNQRIIAQQGSFFLFGILKKKMAGSQFWSKSNPSIGVSFAWIPHQNKKDILKDLRLLGICEETLFPELDKTAQSLKNYVADNIVKRLARREK